MAAAGGFLAALQVPPPGAGAGAGAGAGRGGGGGRTAPRPLLRAEGRATGFGVAAWRPPLGELTPPGGPSWEPRGAGLDPTVVWAVEPRAGGRMTLRNVGSGGLVLRAGPRGRVTLEASAGEEPFALWAPEGAEGLTARGDRVVCLRNVGDPSQRVEVVAHGLVGVLAATLEELSDALRDTREHPLSSEEAAGPEREEAPAEMEERHARKLRHVRGLHAQAEARACLLAGEVEDLRDDLARKGAALGRAEGRSRALAEQIEGLRRALSEARCPSATETSFGGVQGAAAAESAERLHQTRARSAARPALVPVPPSGSGGPYRPQDAHHADDKENMAAAGERSAPPPASAPGGLELFVFQDGPEHAIAESEQPASAPSETTAGEGSASPAQSAGRRQPRTLSPYLEQQEGHAKRRGEEAGPRMSRLDQGETERITALKARKARAAEAQQLSHESFSAKKGEVGIPLTPEMAAAVAAAAPLTPPLGGGPAPPPPPAPPAQLISRCEPKPSRGGAAGKVSPAGHARSALLSAITRGGAEGFKLKSVMDAEPVTTPVSRGGQRPRSFHSELKRGIANRRASMSASPGDMEEW